MNQFRRLRSGYSNLGPIQIPPRPQQLILTDRATGTEYLVSYNTDSPERLSINTAYSTILERKEGVRRYAAFDGPTIGTNNEFILFIRDGHIGLEFDDEGPADRARDAAPPYAFKALNFRVLFIDSENYLTAHIGLRS